MDDLDALLAELEQSSCLASKDRELQGPSSCQDAQHGTLKVPLPPRAQPPGEGLDSVYSTPVPVPKPLLPSPPHTEAARQLDELLADLGHTQSKLAAAGQGAGVPPESLLDNMLDSLTRDLQELGITAAPAGVCAACRKPIAGKVLTALGKTWHPEHFTCARCGQELDKGPFFEQGGQAFCEEDYHQAFSPRCAYCAGPIRQKVLTALEQTWHPEHFFCAHCGKVFGDEGFLERNGKPYCHQDFLAMFAPKCQGCERPVMDNYLSALQGVPDWLQWRLLLRAGGEALLRAALPPAAGHHLPRLRPPRHRALHHGRGAQVPPRALHLQLLPGPAAQGHLPRVRRQDVLPALLRQALSLSPAHSLPAWMSPPSTFLALSLLTQTLTSHPSTSLALVQLSQLSPALRPPRKASFLVPFPARHPWPCSLDLKQ